MLKGPVIPTLSLAAGIALSTTCRLTWWVGTIPIAVALILYLYLLKGAKDPISAFRLGRWHIVWVIMLFIGIGVTDEALNRPLTLEQAFKGSIPDSLTCTVTGVTTKTYGERIDLVIDNTNGAKARIRSGVKDVTPGDILHIPSRYMKELAADTSSIGRKINPMLKASGILYTGRIGPNHIVIVGRSLNPRYKFAELRERIEASIERSHLRKPTIAFLNAILMGDKTGLDEEARLTFANGGMAHVLALSGLHIGILAGFLIMLMWPIKLTGHYKWGYFVAIIALWVYVAVTGMAYSSVRACLMATFAFIGIMAERKNYSGYALCSACLLILIADPAALFDAGFQLSVVCVGSLIAFASRLNPIGHRHHPLLYNVCGTLIATIVATAASWVLTSYYFSQIPLMFLPANVLLLPFLPLYVSLAAVFVISLSMGIEMEWVGKLLDLSYDMLTKGIESMSYGTEFVIDYQVPLWGVALWMVALASCAYLINRKKTT